MALQSSVIDQINQVLENNCYPGFVLPSPRHHFRPSDQRTTCPRSTSVRVKQASQLNVKITYKFLMTISSLFVILWNNQAILPSHLSLIVAGRQSLPPPLTTREYGDITQRMACQTEQGSSCLISTENNCQTTLFHGTCSFSILHTVKAYILTYSNRLLIHRFSNGLSG